MARSSSVAGVQRPSYLEILIVLGLSLGASAVYAVLSLVDRLTQDVPLADQTVAMNTSDSPKPWLDLLYQLVGIGLGLAPAALALYLVSRVAPPVVPAGARERTLGLDITRPGQDLGWGLLLAAGIGLPGIGLYLIGRALGITMNISVQSLGAYWWVVPVLVLAAVKNGLVEEVVVVGYLGTRLTQLGWGPWAWMAASAALRGTYHCYQGWGQALGNVVMGLVFAWFYQRTRRTMPLVVAHTLMDVVAFIGPSLVQPAWLT